MKFLLVLKQERNLTTFLDTLRHLLDRGHEITVALQERDEARDRRFEALVGSERFRVVPCPPERIDSWTSRAALLRQMRDSLRFVGPAFDESWALRERVFERLGEELGGGIAVEALATALRGLPDAQRERLEAILGLAEAALPTSPIFDEFVASHRPDALLISPLVHFGSTQADVAASGHRLGVPVWMLLFSWDNLSTKGCLHVPPDLIFAWNERQRAEAEQLHGYPRSQVVVVGAPRFDEFFTLRPLFSRREFHEPLGLDPTQPTVLYLCSSRLVAPRELEFIQRWLGGLRTSASARLRACNVVVRPHPDIDVVPDGASYSKHAWPSISDLRAQVARPFGDARALVLRTSPRDARGLYESLAHCAAVVGLNTTAELEAGIVGRPVFTIQPGNEGAQQATLHFHYLTKEQGGFVSVAGTLEEHFGQLATALAQDPDPAPIHAFIESFLRPHGFDRPVSPLLAETLEARARVRDGQDAARPEDPMTPAVTLVTVDEPATAVLPLAYPHGRVVMRTASSQLRIADGTIAVDRSVVKWLGQWVRVGDVVYDLHAGDGMCTLIAASQRGAVVVAFEPGYEAYRELCENVRLNGCERSVIAVPLVLGGRDGVAELRYRGMPGSEQHVLRREAWRLRPQQPGGAYAQSVVVARLDGVVEQHDLPRPNHVRISSSAVSAGVLDGAESTLMGASIRSVWVRAGLDHEAAVVHRLESLGLRGSSRRESKRSVQMVFSRVAPTEAS